MAIEYKGEQHCRESFYDKNKFEKIKYNDKMKRKICKSHDLNVIDIKYTWLETEKETEIFYIKMGLRFLSKILNINL